MGITIAVDLDDTLADIAPALYSEFRLLGVPEPDPSRWHFGDPQRMQSACRRLAESGWRGCKLVAGALEVIQGWYLDGHRIVIVTSRPEEQEEPTRAWLEWQALKVRHGDWHGWADLHLIGDACKVRHCQAEKAVVLVEDRASTALRAHEEGLGTVLLDQPWNQLADLPRAMGWRGVDGVQGRVAELLSARRIA